MEQVSISHGSHNCLAINWWHMPKIGQISQLFVYIPFFWAFSPFPPFLNKGRFQKKNLFSKKWRENSKEKVIFFLRKGDFNGRISLRNLGFRKGEKNYQRENLLDIPAHKGQNIKLIIVIILAHGEGDPYGNGRWVSF